MKFVTVVDLNARPAEAVLGIEQYGFGVPTVRVRCNADIDEPMYFAPCTADPDLGLAVVPGPWLTESALLEAAALHVAESGDFGPTDGPADVGLVYWSPVGDGVGREGRLIFMGEQELACEWASDGGGLGEQRREHDGAGEQRGRVLAE